RAPLHSASQRNRISSRLRARRIVYRSIRRQFELARTDMVPCELSAHRIVAEVPPLSGRRIQGRVPDRFPAEDDVAGRRRRTLAADEANFPEGTRRPASGSWDEPTVSGRPELAGPGPLLRVLPW